MTDDEREKRRWSIYFARENGETYEAIAQRWGVCRERIRQIYLLTKKRLERGALVKPPGLDEAWREGMSRAVLQPDGVWRG